MNRAWLWAVGGAGVSVGGFYAFRMYVRKETARVLREEYEYDKVLTQDPKIATLAATLNLPTSTELAESMTPVWSFVLPEKAYEDILEKGRNSIYWPPHRQINPALSFTDSILFPLLKAKYKQSQEEEKQKQLTAK